VIQEEDAKEKNSQNPTTETTLFMGFEIIESSISIT